jgi:hypothetical protein
VNEAKSRNSDAESMNAAAAEPSREMIQTAAASLLKYVGEIFHSPVTACRAVSRHRGGRDFFYFSIAIVC